MELRMDEVAAAVGGEAAGPDATVAGASIDSRTVGSGQLFVPVVAERDGHDFIDAALQGGAGGYLTSRPPVGGSAVKVDDTTEALAALARYTRTRRAGHGPADVIGVTGSVGKTSVKDLLATLLAADRSTFASERSFNNELGVPLTLLNAPSDCSTVVVEMGARGIGHISHLCEMARPTIGVVTRVAAVHTETFGGLEQVAAAKSELPAALPSAGVAVLNADDPRVVAMRALTSARTVTFGRGGDVRADDVELDAELRPRFQLHSPWGSAEVCMSHVRGTHMVENALAAAAAAMAVGVPVEKVATALEKAELSPWRMELHTTAAGGTVVNDAYNANPTSMAAALRSLAALPARRRVAVMGVMAELGPEAEQPHREIGDLARELGIEVIAVDEPAYGGQLVSGVSGAAAALGDVDDGVAVLVKGSRVAGLEQLAARLL